MVLNQLFVFENCIYGFYAKVKINVRYFNQYYKYFNIRIHDNNHILSIFETQKFEKFQPNIIITKKRAKLVLRI